MNLDDGLSDLPEDFPVSDPHGRSPSVQLLIDLLEQNGPCDLEGCARDDATYLANEVGAYVVQAVSTLAAVATLLYEHGHQLVAERVLTHTNALAEDAIKPWLIANGLAATSAEDEL